VGIIGVVSAGCLMVIFFAICDHISYLWTAYAMPSRFLGLLLDRPVFKEIYY
jgi:hypothetical protein